MKTRNLLGLAVAGLSLLTLIAPPPAAGAAVPNSDQVALEDAAPSQETRDALDERLDQATAGPLAIDPAEVDAVLAKFARGNETSRVERVFENGVETEAATAIDFEPNEAAADPATRTIMIKGTSNGTPALVDISVIDGSTAVFLVRDLYLNFTDGQELVGRSIGVSLVGVDTSATPTRGSPDEKTAAAPNISSVGGATYTSSGVSNGVVSMSCGANYNGGRAVNDTSDTYVWYVYGSNFGYSGTVTLGGTVCRVAGWTPTKITVYPTMQWYAQPAWQTLRVSTSGGSSERAYWCIPAIKSRVYGQCTHHVASKRKSYGLQPSPSAYGGYTSITASYVPRVGDQFKWQDRHTAIVTAVWAYHDGAWSRYNLQISEQNADCANGVRTYYDYLEIGGYSNGYRWVNHYPASSVSSFGSCYAYYR